MVTCVGSLVECVLVIIFRFGLFCTVKHFGQRLEVLVVVTVFRSDKFVDGGNGIVFDIEDVR